MQGHGVIGVTRNDEYARLHLPARKLQLHVIARDRPNLLRRRRTDHRGVVPSEARDGLGRLLQPGIVRVFAVANRGIGPEHNFK